MKPNSRWFNSVALAFVIGLVFGRIPFGSAREIPVVPETVTSATAPKSKATWDYYTVTIDAAALASKLAAIGSDGWEVITASPIASSTDQQQFVIVAKRPR